ncbi:MAG TPA: hypothetical protein VFO67_05975 [Gemmatimonadales bacterium]|nr:hypothetical protein [Gemmatimonadales bacterium]
MRSAIVVVLLLVGCGKPPSVPVVTEPQPFRATSEVWSGSSVTIRSAAFAAAELPAVLLDEMPLDAYRVDDTTLAAPLPDAPGPHSLRVVAKDVVATAVVIYLRGFVERVEGPLLNGRVEPGRDPRYLFGSGPTSLRRWNLATNKVVDLPDSVHAVSCTRGVGSGPNVGELVLLTGGCAAGTWMVWRTEPLAPLTDTTSARTSDFVAVLRTGRWVVLDAGRFSIVACNPGQACAAATIADLVGADVVRSAGGDRAALTGGPAGGGFSSGVPVVDVDAGHVRYRVPALTTAKGAAFSPRGDTLFLAGDSAGAPALVAVHARDGQRIASRALGYVPCGVAVDSTRGWLYVAGITTAPAARRSLLQVFDRGTMNPITVLHVTAAITYGDLPCRIQQNPLARRLYVVETSAGELAAPAQIFGFDTPS